MIEHIHTKKGVGWGGHDADIDKSINITRSFDQNKTTQKKRNGNKVRYWLLETRGLYGHQTAVYLRNKGEY